MTTPTPLESLSDRELSECFAREVALLKNVGPCSCKTELQHGGGQTPAAHVPHFATSVDAVQSYLDAQGFWTVTRVSAGYVVYTDSRHPPPTYRAFAQTAARAACIALIQAARAQRADREERK